MMPRKPSLTARHPAVILALFASLSGALIAHAVPAQRPAKPAAKPAASLTGEQVFSQQCASCHGAKGEGGKGYAKPLLGDRSVGQLARLISETMPPGPRKTPLPTAQKVAAFMHDAFYSPVAQARNKPARVELSRLTVRQYRNAVADLIGSFRPAARPAAAAAAERGLHGRYSNRLRGGGAPLLERVDPQIKFDFGTAAAIPAQTDPYVFAMRWEGSVVAPDTGEYELIVKTEHAAQLWVNDARQPLIDALIKSGNGNEYKGSIFLLGGRSYPLRLDFSKGVQGVNDLSKLKQKPPAPASISLEWKRPKQAAEVIPQRCLIPAQAPETFVPAVAFPPDDRSIGYERGTSISKEWDEATTEGAIETAGYVLANLRELSGAADDAPDRAAKLREFSRKFVERALRRPLTPELERVYVTRQFESAGDPEAAVRRVLLLTLKSPRFLYREAGTGTADAYDVASRLSFGLWDSLPDEELLKAAAAGELTTREQVARQAERMTQDLRARAKLQEFFLQWLKVDHHPDLAKDPKRFPDFDEAVQTDLRTSLELSLEEIAWSERSDFRELLRSDQVFLNGRLAKIYGVNLPADAPFQKVSLDPAQRAGIVTHPYLLASFAYLDTSSPIHRGVMISRSLLGRMLMPPPEAFTPVPAELHPKLTTRQRVALQTRPAACKSCHDMINPLGFTLERFDAIGRVRTDENGTPVDTTGSYEPRAGKPVKFSGPRDLSNFLAQSDEVHGAFVEKLFQYMVKQPVRAYGAETLPGLQRSFTTNEFNIRKQLVETMVVAALKR